MVARLLIALVWLALGASVVAWGLRLFAPVTAVPAQAGAGIGTGLTAAAAAGSDWQRVLGVDAVAPAAEPEAAAIEPGLEQRLRLIGVASPREPRAQGRDGVALIAIDGQAPRAYRVGQTIEGRIVLQRVSARGAELGPPGLPAAARLEVPGLPPAATGVLPAAVSGSMTSAVASPNLATTPGFNPAPIPPPAPLPGVARTPNSGPRQAPSQRLDLPPQRGGEPMTRANQ
ncbi:MAG: hypothetical protein ACOVOT_04320 [Rubrivivax sp.]|jgi:general secretion pathway protein C|nr:hypothetical protein [Rubrivivax sp.]